jgi:hypothetical protein
MSAAAIAQYKLIPGEHGVELYFVQGGKEDRLGAPRSVEKADLLQFAFEATREIFEDLVEKGLLTLSRVQFVPALLNCLGDQSGSIEARYGFHSQRIGEG